MERKRKCGKPDPNEERGTPSMVFDTEMYARKLASRNTGGQASKASNIGEVCQFAAAGKEMGKKSLSEIAMSYGYVYVGQIALGANPAQALLAPKGCDTFRKQRLTTVLPSSSDTLHVSSTVLRAIFADD